MILSVWLRNCRKLPLSGQVVSLFGGMTDGYERYKKIMDNPPENLIFQVLYRQNGCGIVCPGGSFLLPSYNELFPMTILEAASCKAPIMLRDLDLYKVILEGDYRATSR